jgi:hypothetical protein
MLFLLKVAALLSSGLFAGAALYLTVVEHPARMSQGASFALQEFRPSYKRAAPIQASLAVICFLCSGVVWWLTTRWAWLAGGVLVGGVVPFTLIFIMPTNRRLLDTNSVPAENEVSSLLAKWGQLHAVRTYLSLIGFVILLVQLVCTDSPRSARLIRQMATGAGQKGSSRVASRDAEFKGFTLGHRRERWPSSMGALYHRKKGSKAGKNKTR